MGNFLILFMFSLLVSLGVFMVLMGQYKEREILLQKGEKLKESTFIVDNKLQYELNFKTSLQDLKIKGEQVLKDEDANLIKLTKQLEAKKSEMVACQEPMKIKSEEVASLQETLISTTATFNAESEVWKQEIINLKANLTAHSPICDYVNKTKAAMKLCGAQSKSD